MGWLSKIFGGSRKQSNGVLVPHPPRRLKGTPAKIYSRPQAYAKCRLLYEYSYAQFADNNLASMHSHNVRDLARWWKSVEDNLIDAGYGYLSEVSDCDDRATWAMALSRMIYRDVEASLLVVKIGVDMKQSALGIKQGPKHMTNAVYTDRGWIIVEFPTGQYCKLEDYPNPIYKVWTH